MSAATAARLAVPAAAVLAAGAVAVPARAADAALKVDIVSVTGTGCVKDGITVTHDYQQVRFAVRDLRVDAAKPGATCVLTLDLTAPAKQTYAITDATVAGQRTIEAGSTGSVRAIVGHGKDAKDVTEPMIKGEGAWFKGIDTAGQKGAGCGKAGRYTLDLALKLDPARGADSVKVEDLALKYQLNDC
ncbi:DUF4360 domain-containing protein [Pilimelia anulata]|uniref:DUF4360 domain-containing protein n=1 Tax=Pilimelia anulata TaxID=53371 RepID=UPI00166E5903|nr:DUF4360 domain-containing protein [Pilimelia anulata]